MDNKSFTLHIKNKIKPFKKVIEVDSDKSMSIRSFLISAISHNISDVKNVLESEDVLSCVNCLRKLGVKILKIKNKEYKIYGKDISINLSKEISKSDENVEVINSMGLLKAQGFKNLDYDGKIFFEGEVEFVINK